MHNLGTLFQAEFATPCVFETRWACETALGIGFHVVPGWQGEWHKFRSSSRRVVVSRSGRCQSIHILFLFYNKDFGYSNVE